MVTKVVNKKNPFKDLMGAYKTNSVKQTDQGEDGNNDNLFMNLFNDEENEWTRGVAKNATINAEVLRIDEQNEIVEVRTGLKSNSFMSFKEFRNNNELNLPLVGSFISVIMERIDSKTGMVHVSHKKVQFDARLKEIEEKYLARKEAENNKQFDVQGKYNIEGIVLYKQKASTTNQYKNNSYIVDLGCGVLGLLIPDGFSELELNKKVTLVIHRFENKKFGIIVGIKKDPLENNVTDGHNTYENHNNSLKEGESFEVKIVEHKDFGLLCKKTSGDDECLYFIANNYLTIHQRIRKKNEIVRLYPLNTLLQVVCIKIKDNQGQEKLILSARKLFENLVEKFITFLKEQGEDKPYRLSSTVVEKRESEIIIKIDFDKNIVEGKITKEELSWNHIKAINAFRTIIPGDNLEVAINWQEYHSMEHNFDPEYHFLPFSVRILIPDPLKAVLSHIEVGQIYQCKIIGNNEYGALASILLPKTGEWTKPDVDILLSNKELRELRDTNTKPGSIHHAKVIKIDQVTRGINISIKSAEMEDIAKYKNAQVEEGKYTTLNTIIRKKK